MKTRAASLALTLSVALALWAASGAAGLLYVLVFVAACAPGVPIGTAVFGNRHPVAWIGGGLVGYGVTSLVIWALISAGVASTLTIAAAWIVVFGIAWVATRRMSSPLVSGPVWSAAATRALLVVLLLVPLLMGLTYRNLGREDEQGNRYYRAYFTADFLWHSALAYEVGKLSLPPRNPYLAPRTMNYYWTYFLVPATAARLAPVHGPAGQDVQLYLKANAILAGLLMMGALFVLVHSGTASSTAAALAVTLAVLAASAEGLYAIVDLLVHGRPLRALLDTNVDAITAWSFGGLRVDNIPRSLWYTPQHTTSIALGLVGLTTVVTAGAFGRVAAIAFAGLALGLATTMNPLLGAAASVMYGACVLVDVQRKPGAVAALARHGIAAAFVAAAIAWGAASKVMEGAGSALDVGFHGFSRNSPIVTLLLSLGPVLLPALPGAFRARTDGERRAVTIAVAGILLGLFLLYFVRISEASWVGFRAGQILLVSIPILLARTLAHASGPWRAVLVTTILIAGVPTTAVDTYNAQDIGNRRPGPGFRWTLWTTRAQEDAFSWIRANTREDDIVQMEPMVRGREHWTLIPSFAGRRMAAGLPISLLPLPEYQQRSEQVRTLYASGNAQEARDIARRLRIDYLYVDREDTAAYAEGVAKFDANPAMFTRVFTNAEVRLYRVE